MIPWIILALVAVPLVVIAFVARRRQTRVRETAAPPARTADDFAEAEAYEARWHEEDKERFRRERLP